MNRHPKWVEFMKEQFPPGTHIRLNEMKDPYAPVPPGTEGTVDFVDDACNIHMIWDNGRTLSLIPGEDRFSVIAPKLTEMKLYMPLLVDTYERNEYGDLEEYPTETDNRAAVDYADTINTAITRFRMPQEKERGIMNWYREGDGVDEKIYSAEFSVENVDGRLWGVVEYTVTGELTPEETESFETYVTGQAADGWGESFEQHPIKTPAGELYVHLWSGNNDWRLYTEDEALSGQGQKPEMRLE
jgi:hypothetical protein